MLYNILGVIYIIVAIWEGLFILNNKKDMPFDVYRLKKENYQVIDKDKFNTIMVKQNIFLFIWILSSGILCIFCKIEICIALPAFSIFINRIFSEKAKKYLKAKQSIST